VKILIKSLKSNSGGIAIVLLWSAVFFIVILISVFVLDAYYANVKAEIAKDAVTMSAMSVYKGVDISQIESGNITSTDQMLNAFKEYLVKNMKLNDDLTSKPGSIAVGQVMVEDFRVYNQSDTDKNYPDGTGIHYKPSLYVKIKFDIEPILKGVVGKKTVYTSATADLIAKNK
jgi:hypothetical protein